MKVGESRPRIGRGELIKIHWELLPGSVDSSLHAFLDEPRIAAGWERGVRTPHDARLGSLPIASFGREFSVHALHRLLRGQGFAATRNTFCDQVGHAVDATGGFLVNRWAPSLKAREAAIPKCYLSDPGFAGLVTGFAELVPAWKWLLAPARQAFEASPSAPAPRGTSAGGRI